MYIFRANYLDQDLAQDPADWLPGPYGFQDLMASPDPAPGPRTRLALRDQTPRLDPARDSGLDLQNPETGPTSRPPEPPSEEATMTRRAHD